MNTETVRALQELRGRMATECARLKELDSKFEHPYFRKIAQRAVSDCEDAEIMFLWPLERESWRNLDQELNAIRYADIVFQLAISQRKFLEETIAKYGPSVVATPYP
jgi:hypothetical protein